MPIRDGEHRGVGDAARHVAEHASSLARLEVELAAIELKRKVVALGIGIGTGAGALVLVFFGLGFGAATIAAVLATFMRTWLALLVTTGGLLALAGLLVAIALVTIRKGTPPLPEQAIAEAKLTTEALKSDGSR
jgi:uncharacterized membrane protein YqjE